MSTEFALLLVNNKLMIVARVDMLLCHSMRQRIDGRSTDSHHDMRIKAWDKIARRP